MLFGQIMGGSALGKDPGGRSGGDGLGLTASMQIDFN